MLRNFINDSYLTFFTLICWRKSGPLTELSVNVCSCLGVISTSPVFATTWAVCSALTLLQTTQTSKLCLSVCRHSPRWRNGLTRGLLQTCNLMSPDFSLLASADIVVVFHGCSNWVSFVCSITNFNKRFLSFDFCFFLWTRLKMLKFNTVEPPIFRLRSEWKKMSDNHRSKETTFKVSQN